MPSSCGWEMSILQNLKAKRGSFELHIPHMALPRGKVTVLFGDSGSGKSTLLGLLTGQIPGDFIWQDGSVVLSDLSPPERRLGVVFQEPGLFPHMTGKQNILFAARARDVSLRQTEELLDELEPVFQLRSFLPLKVADLSGGQVQRIAMARSLVAEPRALLWDEPFSALHATMKSRLREFLKNYAARQDLPVLLISHDLEDQSFFAPYILKIEDGRLTGLDQEDPAGGC